MITNEAIIGAAADYTMQHVYYEHCKPTAAAAFKAGVRWALRQTQSESLAKLTKQE